MADDIVTRLRVQTAHKIDVVSQLDMKCLCCPCCEETCIYCEAVYEFDRAADEIERLRAICEVLTNAPFGSSAWNNAKQLWSIINV